MKSALTILIILLTQSLTFSQDYQHQLDSIWKVISKSSEDTVEIMALFELTFTYPPSQ
ncbi:MAG: hypothetical protein H8E61_08180, partial [Bacteroidetes bacterium]|nr:hypothetical protein [Bacteroidota bacterium]